MSFKGGEFSTGTMGNFQPELTSLYLYENRRDSKGQKRQKQWRVASGEWRATGSGKIPSPLRCMGKSAEMIDEKGVAMLRGGQRVRKWMKRQGLDVEGWKRGPSTRPEKASGAHKSCCARSPTLRTGQAGLASLVGCSVAGLRCGQRVRNYMKTKGMVDLEAAADLTDFADKRAIGGDRGTWGPGRAGGQS
jgi:hypothetical protein